MRNVRVATFWGIKLNKYAHYSLHSIWMVMLAQGPALIHYACSTIATYSNAMRTGPCSCYPCMSAVGANLRLTCARLTCLTSISSTLYDIVYIAHCPKHIIALPKPWTMMIERLMLPLGGGKVWQTG